MSYDPTCKKWWRRYETNIDTRPLAYHLDREVWDEEAQDFLPAQEDDLEDRWVPLEYEVEAAYRGGGGRDVPFRLHRSDGVFRQVEDENWMWIAEYGGEQQISPAGRPPEKCPSSIGTSNPSSPGWRRTCERAALSNIRKSISYDLGRRVQPIAAARWNDGEWEIQDDLSVPLYRFHKSRDKELRIRPVGPWKCAE